MSNKFLIYGLGRMGLTHYAILNQLQKNALFTFIEPDRKVNYFAKKNLKAEVLDTDQKLEDDFDYALICTPPMFHIPILEKCLQKRVANIFVEKPFGGIQNNFSRIINANHSVKVGYVLRFNQIIQRVKAITDISKILRVEGYYYSNTLEKKPKGWRNSSYSGVTNEIGSHIIDLSVYLFSLSSPSIIYKKLDSVVSNVDDIITADLLDNNIEYHFHFNWVNKEYRKPVFKFIVTMNDGTTFKFDQQKIEFFNNGILVNRYTSVDAAMSVPFYLRGIDFTSQMQDFIGNQKIMATVNEALITRDLIKKLIS